MESIVLKPIGVVHREASDDEVRQETHGLDSVIEVYPEYQDALDGLEGYSHLFVLGYFHKLRPEQGGLLKVRPKRMTRYGLRVEELPLVGDFALDSPTRPNPIGLSLVRLLQIEEGRKLLVRDLDYFDGTPVLDIKPYQAGYRAEEYRLPRWATELALKAGLPPSESL
jgi:tRNA-Thr(GGU) m(6)t(6)A37 methyltransferase TsaA